MDKRVGERIRAFREKQNLSLADFAERTGLEESFLLAVETEDLYPSLGPLLKIARALGLRLGTFLDDQVSRDPLIVRQGERTREMAMRVDGTMNASHLYSSLGRGKTDRHMEPFFIEMTPEAEADKKLSSHEGEEFIVVVSGQVQLVFGRETSILNPGDSIYFNSVVPHNVSAVGGPASIYAVLYFPE
ncbi:MAG: cupin domain-containing protein [Humidesulfovibrio sp.]|uniref:helix-turn-helix domain-containing protein n=1 Tax=Humidesulfovibrio sp. TaxID=2910988 RepID=UPI0027F3A0FA|nr:cupin domain-containing protein [Humidesulfovibrio sp.]MDQ7836174.1 cupin domain-containing protein [Humidesulfovibrio sp.]